MKSRSQLTARFGRPVVAARRTPSAREVSSTTAPAAAYALRRARAGVASTGQVPPRAPPAGATAAIVAADRAVRAMLSLKPRGE
jgi:hypothetical protein